MPNTLAHLGVQGFATRTIIKGDDFKWIFLGVIIPDLPWITRRIVLFVLPDIDPLDLRLYAIAQASLFSCLLLSAALAFLSRRPGLVFMILGLNSLFHLLLDMVQTKWGNGVNLMAPFSWKVWNFGFFWPEGLITISLTIFGLAYTLFMWKRLIKAPSTGTKLPGIKSVMAALVMILIYVLFPLACMSSIESFDAHSIASIRKACTNCPVAFDKVYYRKDGNKDILDTWAGRNYEIEGKHLDHASKVSIRGKFVDPTTIFIDELYEHRGFDRDVASYIGLALIATIWVRSTRFKM